jgi:MoaA/NifB/PqqE/SkfB family radical SAM enzyme
MHACSRGELEQRGLRFGYMAWETFCDIVGQIAAFPKKIKKVTLSGNGEPLLHNRLPDMVRALRASGNVEKTLVVSNGTLLTAELGAALVDAGLQEMRISLQGINAAKYKEISGIDIDFDMFCQNLRYFYEHRKNCLFKIKVADSALDDGDEEAFYKLFGDICDYIDVEHIYTQFQGVDYSGKLRDANRRTRYGYNYEKLSVCSALFFKLNVLWDGRITFGYPDGVIFDGFNTEESTLSATWNSPERLSLLLSHLNGDYSLRPECKSCTRWDNSILPTELLDGHETEIIAKMPKLDAAYAQLRKAVTICANNS